MWWRTVLIVGMGLINLVLFYHMIWSSAGLLVYRELKARHAELEAQVEALEKENLDLSREIRLLQSDNSYVEKKIRQHLHYVRDNELLYLFTDEMPASTSGGQTDDRKD